LITANHVLSGEDYGLQDLAMPDTPNGVSMKTFGSLDIRKEVRQDIAILRFKNDETIQRVTENWHVLSGGDIQLSISKGPLAIAGCPRELVKTRKTMLHAGWIAMFVDQCVPSELDEQLAVEAGLAQPMDFCARYPTNVYRHDASLAATPESVKGLSGGSVWQMVHEVQGVWTPQKAMRIVGMQVSASPGKYERVRSWKTVSAVYYSDADKALK
jgi:hypothetical protein